MNTLSKSQFSKDEIIREGDGNRVIECVVFTDQAHVKRHAPISAQSGLNRLMMELQAFQVDPDSIQAVVHGRGEIISVQYKEMTVKDAPQEEVKQLENDIKKLKRKRRRLEQSKQLLEKQNQFLDSVIGFGQTEIPKKLKTAFPKTDDLQTMLGFLEQNYQNLASEKENLLHQLEDLDDELAVLKARLNQIQQPQRKLFKSIEVLFMARESHEIELTVAYIAQNAFWEPVYKVDVPLDLSRLDMTMFARIRQKTGEDWQNVKLSVSNAMPLKGATLPDPQPWRVGVLKPAPAAMMAGAEPTKLKRAKAQFDQEADLMEASLAEPEAQFTQAQEKKLPLAFEYQLPQPTDICSGGDETLLPLYTKEMTPDFHIYTAPAIDPLCYLVCQAAPESALLAGKLNIYFGGRFVGGSSLTEKQAGEELLINLGADRGVKARRSKRSDAVTETFFGMVDRMSTARKVVYGVTIENLKDEAVRVCLIDRIPVSKTDRIQIKGVELKPEPTERDYLKREGVMRWDLEIPSQSHKSIEIQFGIKHPKNVKDDLIT